MATFNGSNIFGTVLETYPVANPPARQFTEYSGVNGVSSIFLGSRGGRTHIRGIISGSAYTDVYALEDLIRTVQVGGLSAVFVNDFGDVFPSSIIESFRPRGRIIHSPGNGWMREYDLTMFHHI